MSDKVVLDASAIMALLAKERGHEHLTPDLLGAAIASTVNLAEVQAKLVTRGLDPERAWEYATSPISELVAFDREQARICGSLVAETQHLGLSLGDRACIALGISLDCPVYTVEKAWKKLKLKLRVHVIR